MSTWFDPTLKRAGYTARLFLRDTAGGTAIEYGLIAGLLSIVIFSGVAEVSSRLTSVFKLVESGFPK